MLMRKRFTLMLIAVLMTVVSNAQPVAKTQFQSLPLKLSLSEVPMNVKQAPSALVRKTVKAKAPRRVEVSAADLAGNYDAAYYTVEELPADDSTEPSNPSEGSGHVTLTESDEGLTVSGLSYFDDFTATVQVEEGETYLVIPTGQMVYTHSTYGECALQAFFYYEGDDEYEAGWYQDTDIYAQVGADGVITFDAAQYIAMTISSGTYAGYVLGTYIVPSMTLTPGEALVPVELPAGVEPVEYILNYNNSDSTTASKTVAIAIDGSDFYIQGLSDYIPDAWIKGVISGNTISIAAGQYIGSYASYDSYTYVDAVFVYDFETDTYTLQADGDGDAEYFNLLGGQYYDGRYYNMVITPMPDEVAATPATPTITGIEATQYGDVVLFNVPLEDTEGNKLVPSKLFYRFYYDTLDEQGLVTFTPDDFSKLEEDMTEIPFGFTENYDFYADEIYLNMYHENWYNIGIQSVYYGAGETHESEIFWYVIKEPAEGIIWVAADNCTDQEEVTDIDFGEKLVYGYADKATGANPPKYYTNQGASLRMYTNNTLTIESRAFPIQKINFTVTATRYAAFTAETGTLASNAEVVTWTPADGETVTEAVFGFSAQTRIVQIAVIVDETALVPVPETLEAETYTFKAVIINEEEDADTGDVTTTEEAVVRNVQVGTDGNYVYFQGLDDTVDGWVVGKKNADGSVYIAADENLGTYSYYGLFEYPITTAETTLTYNGDADQYTADELIINYTYYGSVYPWNEYNNVVILKVAEVAATPADPSFTDYNFVARYPYVDLSIPAVGTEGEDLVLDKLSYKLYYETEEGVGEYIVQPDFYVEIAEEMTEIPYNFTDDEDIFAGGARVYIYGYDFTTWKRVGVQSIYDGLGERNVSNIVWEDLSDYWEALGIQDITSNGKASVKYYDLQGRVATADTKGIVIAVARQADGTIRTQKMLRK